MSQLTSTSTIDEIKAAIANNSAYELTGGQGGVLQAKLLIQAITIYLFRIPSMSQQGSSQGTSRFEYDAPTLRSMQIDARLWVNANDHTLDRRVIGVGPQTGYGQYPYPGPCTP